MAVAAPRLISDAEMFALRSVENTGPETELWFTPSDAAPRVWFRLDADELRDAIARLASAEAEPVYGEMLGKLRRLLTMYEAQADGAPPNEAAP